MIRFRAQETHEGKPVFLLVWTTTPWTLPSNLALAVGKDLDYAFVDQGDFFYVLNRDSIGRYASVLGDNPRVCEVKKGEALVGLRYEPIFPYFSGQSAGGRFRTLSADFVDTAEGTCIVHIAPGFGEDDYWLCREAGIETVCPVDETGAFTADVPDYAGKNVLQSNAEIIKRLKSEGSLLEQKTIDHNYPHCWRCREPLIYRATTAWYFAVEKIKDRMIELNEDIHWVPNTVKHGRFGNWLKGARDWNISRNRYWSTPIPVWICDRCGQQKVLGSIAEIEEQSGTKVEDLHKEHLDRIEFSCSCGGAFKRVPEVLDCWFESASMPFAQKHYPFENREWFESHFPADFIVEYTGQIRCWFYYLHVLSTALFDRPAFRHCLVHSTILAEDGKKLSKSSRNYTDPLSLMRKYGTDSFRLGLFMTSSVLLGDLLFKEAFLLAAYQKVIRPLWSAFSFYDLYARVDGYAPDEEALPEPTNEQDKWMLARLYQLADHTTRVLNDYEINDYAPPIASFIDDLTNWYIRRARRRFYGPGIDSDKKSAYDTLYYVLASTCKILAPLAPIITEHIFLKLTKQESVHLTRWPSLPSRYNDEDLVAEISVIREIIGLGRMLREQCRIRNRQPLSLLKVGRNAKYDDIVARHASLICDELNVKTVSVADDPEKLARVHYAPNLRSLGPKLGKDMRAVDKAIREGKLRFLSDAIQVELEGKEVSIGLDDVMLRYEAKEGMPVAGHFDIVVALDVEITEELRREGVARDLIRHIQEMRKQCALKVTDRIVIEIDGAFPSEWSERIAQETLGRFDSMTNPGHETNFEAGDEEKYTVRIQVDGEI